MDAIGKCASVILCARPHAEKYELGCKNDKLHCNFSNKIIKCVKREKIYDWLTWTKIESKEKWEEKKTTTKYSGTWKLAISNERKKIQINEQKYLKSFYFKFKMGIYSNGFWLFEATTESIWIFYKIIISTFISNVCHAWRDTK